MPRRKTAKEHIRNIQKARSGYYISIPIGIIKTLGWKERQKVKVLRDKRKIVISDWKK